MLRLLIDRGMCPLVFDLFHKARAVRQDMRLEERQLHGEEAKKKQKEQKEGNKTNKTIQKTAER